MAWARTLWTLPLALSQIVSRSWPRVESVSLFICASLIDCDAMALPSMERSSGVHCCSCRPTMSISTQNGAHFSFRVVFTTKSCFGIPRQGLASAAIAMANWELRSIPFAWLSEKPCHTEHRGTLTNRGFDLLAATFPQHTTHQDHRSERAKHRPWVVQRLWWSRRVFDIS